MTDTEHGPASKRSLKRVEDDAPIVLRQGAVALIDALGLRGIWRNDPALVVQQIRATRQTASRGATTQSLFQPSKLLVASFSDTLLLGGTVSERSSLEDVIGRLAGVVACIQSSQIKDKLPLNYRGCISAGRIALGHDFFIGEAVDDAATLYEQAQAAVVWLTPAAREAVDKTKLGLSLLEWPVPLKGGGSLVALVVNPFAAIANKDADTIDRSALDVLFERFKQPFASSRSLDVAQKAQNIMRFLELARAFTVDNFQTFSDEYYDQMAQMHEDYNNGLI